MSYQDLITEVEREKIEIFENSYIGKLKGLYVDNTITLNTSITTEIEKKCILVEELGHYHKTVGDIRDQTKTENRKQEHIARAWGYEKLVNLLDIIDAKKEGIINQYELADHLGVTEEFLVDAIKYYKEKYGGACLFGEYIIEFQPLEVYKKIDLK